MSPQPIPQPVQVATHCDLDKMASTAAPQYNTISSVNLSDRNKGDQGGSLEDILTRSDPTQANLMNSETVIQVDLNDKPVRALSKLEAHMMSTIRRGTLHRAISVFLFNSRGELLITQRASSKFTYPGVWTNSLCSHPRAVVEEMDTSREAIGCRLAAIRRLADELGIKPSDVDPEEINYMWRTTYPIKPCTAHNEVFGEFEMDYLLVIQKDIPLVPNPNEVDAVRWVSREDIIPVMQEIEKSGGTISPWFRCFLESGDLMHIWDNLSSLDAIKDHKTIKYRH